MYSINDCNNIVLWSHFYQNNIWRTRGGPKTTPYSKATQSIPFLSKNQLNQHIVTSSQWYCRLWSVVNVVLSVIEEQPGRSSRVQEPLFLLISLSLPLTLSLRTLFLYPIWKRLEVSDSFYKVDFYLWPSFWWVVVSFTVYLDLC